MYSFKNTLSGCKSKYSYLYSSNDYCFNHYMHDIHFIKYTNTLLYVYIMSSVINFYKIVFCSSKALFRL